MSIDIPTYRARISRYLDLEATDWNGLLQVRLVLLTSTGAERCCTTLSSTTIQRLADALSVAQRAA